jgi:hypothetical protein
MTAVRPRMLCNPFFAWGNNSGGGTVSRVTIDTAGRIVCNPAALACWA